MIIVHYEVYVLESRGWMLHARFPRLERDAAIGEAKELETTLNVRVKVLRETYYPDKNAFDEAEVYISGVGMAKPAKPAAQAIARAAPRQNWADQGPARAAPSARRAGPSAPGSRRAPAKVAGAGGVLWRMFLIVLVSIALALAAIRVTPNVVTLLFDYGFRISPDSYGQLLFAVFVMVFLMTAVPLSVRFLPHNAELRFSKPSFGWAGGDSQPKDAELKRSLDKLVSRAASQPQAAEAEPPPLDEEPLPEILPGPEEDLPEIRPDPDEAQPDIRPEADEPEDHPSDERPDPRERETPEFEAHNLVAMRFLGAAISALKEIGATLDKFNKFALNLYMAGAIETLGERQRLDDPLQRKLLKASLETLGTSAEMAQTLHDKLDTYMAEPRYMHIIQSGRNSMDSWLSGDETSAHRGLTDAVKGWNKKVEKKASIVTVMFTDMVGSTDLTQARGDAAAQEVVRRHNAIVRTALAQFAGKEIKHTGDGIMASFPSAANAVEAAASIQRQVAAHNERMPELALHLRIGLNAGEPIEEEDDLFGTTVQLAARVCAATDTDQILCTQVVRDLSFGKSASFVSAGDHRLKGFKETMTLWEVDWRA